MNIECLNRRLSPLEYAAVVDAAKLRAVELRREAMHDFGSAVARGTRDAWHALPRRTRSGACEQRAGEALT